MTERHTYAKKIIGYDAMRFDPGRDNLLSMRDDAAHTKLRNKMAAGVSSVQVSFSYLR